MFNVSTPVTFANTTIVFAPNTVEIIVKIRNWPFLSVKNQLAIAINMGTNVQAPHTCNMNAGVDVSGSVQWYMMTINGVSMYVNA